MSSEVQQNAIPSGDEAPAPAPRTTFELGYAGPSLVVSEQGKARIELLGNTHRPPVRASGKVREPIPLREAFSALYEVVAADHRYAPRDRTAYLAYQRMRKQLSGLTVWQAQRAYSEWMARNDPLAFMILDPVVTVHPDEVFFEVFSKDEGSYAKLSVDWSALELEGELGCGTTNIDYSKALFDGVQRMRSYRETRLSIGRDEVKLKTGEKYEALEKKIQAPDSWLRGFLQVQSAATLPWTSFSLAPIDLYNALRELRLHADRKKGGRAIRVELAPGEHPRLVLEPWNKILETHGGPYKGKTAQMVRIWGRRRLMSLRRMLPYADRIDVHLLGTGLPSFYVLRAGPLSLTLGLTGFTSANWSQALSFDLMLPRPLNTSEELAKVVGFLERHWQAPAKTIAKELGMKPAVVLEALQHCCQQGKLVYDLAKDVYRLRPLTGEPLDLPRLEFRSQRERQAHDLLLAKGAVRLVTENRVFGEGLELTGKVVVEAEKREYRPQIVLDDEGRVKQAECTCNFFRKHQLKEGPCLHLIALRVLQAREEAKRRQGTSATRAAITMETRTYAKRRGKSEEIHQISLDRKRLKLRWGERGERLRVQSLSFGSVDEARGAYFAKVEKLEAAGFMDMTAG